MKEEPRPLQGKKRVRSNIRRCQRDALYMDHTGALCLLRTYGEMHLWHIWNGYAQTGSLEIEAQWRSRVALFGKRYLATQ